MCIIVVRETTYKKKNDQLQQNKCCEISIVVIRMELLICSCPGPDLEWELGIKWSVIRSRKVKVWYTLGLFVYLPSYVTPYCHPPVGPYETFRSKVPSTQRVPGVFMCLIEPKLSQSLLSLSKGFDSCVGDSDT